MRESRVFKIVVEEIGLVMFRLPTSLTERLERMVFEVKNAGSKMVEDYEEVCGCYFSS